jgi:hypothetical protein
MSGIGEAFDELTQTLDVGPLSQTATEEPWLLSVSTVMVTFGVLPTVHLEVTPVCFLSRFPMNVEIEASSQQPPS